MNLTNLLQLMITLAPLAIGIRLGIPAIRRLVQNTYHDQKLDEAYHEGLALYFDAASDYLPDPEKLQKAKSYLAATAKAGVDMTPWWLPLRQMKWYGRWNRWSSLVEKFREEEIK